MKFTLCVLLGASLQQIGRCFIRKYLRQFKNVRKFFFVYLRIKISPNVYLYVNPGFNEQ